MKHMHSRIFTIAVLALLSGVPLLQGSESVSSYGLAKEAQPLFQFVEGNKVGVINDKGQVVVPATFQSVGDFFEDRASFKDNSEKYGFINAVGVKVIAASFDEVRPFSEGLAAVRIGRLWGYVDTNGVVVIAPQFQAVGPMKGGLARVASWDHFTCLGGPSELSNEEAPENLFALPDEQMASSCSASGIKFGYINGAGRIFISQGYAYAYDFSEALARVKVGDRIGYVDQTGKMVIQPQFADGTDFAEGVVTVQLPNGWAYVDKTGKAISDQRFDYAYAFSEGLAAVRMVSSDRAIDGKCGYIDHSGTFILAPRYDSCEPFSSGLALVTKENDTDSPSRYFINKVGERAFSQNIDSISSFTGGISLVKLNGKKVYVDRTGRTVKSFD